MIDPVAPAVNPRDCRRRRIHDGHDVSESTSARDAMSPHVFAGSWRASGGSGPIFSHLAPNLAKSSAAERRPVRARWRCQKKVGGHLTHWRGPGDGSGVSRGPSALRVVHSRLICPRIRRRRWIRRWTSGARRRPAKTTPSPRRSPWRASGCSWRTSIRAWAACSAGRSATPDATCAAYAMARRRWSSRKRRTWPTTT